ncbi:hypothetical protein FS837_004533, partial [Tulasnella sp. UAMH 9824]
GNENADRAAKAGADGKGETVFDLTVLAGWQREGAKLSALTYGSAYAWIREREAKSKAMMAPTNVERVLDELLDTFGQRIDKVKLWRSLREPYIRREISDFLWLMLHRRSQCGTMFRKWGPEWEDLQYCECGVVESMEHILTQPPTFAEIMGVSAVQLNNQVATRLWATIVSETAFTIWKLRNRRRFDGLDVRTAVALNSWRANLEKRAKMDLALTRVKRLKTTTETQRATDTVAVWKWIISTKGGATTWIYADHG